MIKRICFISVFGIREGGDICHIQAEEEVHMAGRMAAAAAANLRCVMGTDIIAEPTGLFITIMALRNIISVKNPIPWKPQKRGKQDR